VTNDVSEAQRRRMGSTYPLSISGSLS